MSEEHAEDLIKFAAILDEFAASQRALALTQTNKQRITLRRNVASNCEIVLEKVLDADASAAELYQAIEPVSGAIDRLANFVEMRSWYDRLAEAVNMLTVEIKTLAADQVTIQSENEERNRDRRVPKLHRASLADRVKLDNHRTSIRSLNADIDTYKKEIANCRRVIGGEDPFAVLDEKIETNLGKLRGMAAEPVAA